jgi:hypothetical protein
MNAVLKKFSKLCDVEGFLAYSSILFFGVLLFFFIVFLGVTYIRRNRRVHQTLTSTIADGGIHDVYFPLAFIVSGRQHKTEQT